jgi:hypothetical protein
MRLPRFGTSGVASALVAALAASCLLELDHEIACGDGYVDRLGGEECDPAVQSSYVDRCAGTSRPDGQAACDPVLCTVINDKAQCATCGDGTVDAEFGEQCDGPNLNGRTCLGGGDGLQCAADCQFDYSQCDPCGNGLLDEDEECDPNQMGDLVIPRQCAGSDEVDPLEPVDKPYASGETVRCKDECRYDRTQCGFCGDGTRDKGIYVDFEVLGPPEWCDGDNYDDDLIVEQFGRCEDETTRKNVGCGVDCRSFVDRTDIAQCCRRKSEACPAVGDATRCCYEYDHPDEEPCQELFEGMVVRRVCR